MVYSKTAVLSLYRIEHGRVSSTKTIRQFLGARGNAAVGQESGVGPLPAGRGLGPLIPGLSLIVLGASVPRSCSSVQRSKTFAAASSYLFSPFSISFPSHSTLPSYNPLFVALPFSIPFHPPHLQSALRGDAAETPSPATIRSSWSSYLFSPPATTRSSWRRS